jgi:hypothetical protein
MNFNSLLVLFLLAVGESALPYGALPRSPSGHAVATASDSISTDEFDPIVRAAGLTPLRSTRLAAGQREIRVWIGGGIGYPQDLYRIVDQGKGKVLGWLIFHWPADDDAKSGAKKGRTFNDVVTYHQRGRCSNFRRSREVAVCDANFDTRPEWSTVLREADAAGLWTLPDESLLPKSDIITTDGWGITIELRNGLTYRAYSYGNPDDKAWPEAKLAVRIAKAFRRIDSYVTRSDAEKDYRGVYSSGPSLSEFRQCSSKEQWGFQGNLEGYSSWSNRPRGDSTVTGIKRQFITVRGSLTPEWLAREWNSEYKRVLEVSKILSSRPTELPSC